MTRALITGAGRGIGLELTRLLLARGDEVIATVRDLRVPELAAFPRERLTILPMDVVIAESVRVARKSVSGPIDVLVNNAGMTGGPQHAPGMDLARAEAILEVNAMGPLRVYDAFVDLLRASKGPRKLVNVSSEAASLSHFRPSGKPEYAMSKAALNVLTRWIAAKEDGLICVSIDPGWTKTRTGGEGATQSAEEAARRMASAIDGLTPEHSGGFFDADLRAIPW